MNRVVIYYSYTGNTRSLVEQIVEKWNYDVIEIKPVVPYSKDYQKVVDEAVKQVKNGYQPEIEKIEVDFSKYDAVILAAPVWWYSYASPINTFLHQYDLNNKEIIPLITNGGWLGHTIEDVKKVSKGRIQKEISVEFDEDKLRDEKKFKEWLENLEN